MKNKNVLLIVLLLVVLLVIFFAKECNTHIQTQAINNNQPSSQITMSSQTTMSSHIIEQQKLSDNNIKTTVSEKINNTLVPTVIIKSNEPIKEIQTIPREYRLSIKETDNTVTPILNITSNSNIVTITGNTVTKTNIHNGIIFKPFVLGGLAISQDINYNIIGGVGVNWLKYNKLMLLSPSISINYNLKDKEITGGINIEPIKYKIYSNTLIGINIGIDNKSRYVGGIGMSIEI